MRVKFLVTPMGLMMGNIESARRLRNALADQGVEVTDDPKAEEFDILHVHTPVPPKNFRIVKKTKKNGKPVLLHAHTTAEDSVGTWTGSGVLSGVTGRYLTRFYNLGDLVIAPSAWTKRRLEERGVRAPIRVLSNGVDLDRFKPDPVRREAFRSRYGIDARSMVVYSIGVICLKKGVEVIPDIAKALPDLQFVWVGRRSMIYHPLRVGRATRRCPGNVRFIHDVSDIADAHNGGDCFFTPSFVENQGMAVMEAMAERKPIVARNLEVYQGLLKEGESALLCDSREDFVSAIDRITKDGASTKAMTENARSAVEEHDIRKVARELTSIYESLLGSRAKQEGS